MEKNNLVYGIHDRPKLGQVIVFALQQLLAVLAATILVPTIIGLPMQMPAALLGAGVGTIIYLVITKFRSPVFLGSSFAFLGSLGTAVGYGYLGIILGSVFAGLVYVIIAIVIHFAGTNWVSKLLPPVIIGPTVALIGLSLAGNAMGDIVKATVPSTHSGYNLIGLLCGLVAFFAIIICSTQKRFKMPRLIPFIIGIVAGYVVAAIFTAIGTATDVAYLQIIDFTPIKNNFVSADGSFVGITAFLDYPDFALIEGIKEIVKGEAQISGAKFLNDIGGVAEIAIAFIPVALVVFAEHIADHKNLSTIVGKDLIEDPGLKRTLLGDGIGSIAGTILGICPNTTYGESVGCVAITKNASIITIFVTAIMCIVVSFFSPLMAILRTIPNCVMGGVCLTLYGFIAVSGLKMFKEVDLNASKNLFVVAAILISGIGGLAIQIPYSSQLAYNANGVAIGFAKVITVTPIATALILGIVSNAILSAIEKSKLGVEPEAVESGEKVEEVSDTIPQEVAQDETTVQEEVANEEVKVEESAEA